MIRPKANHFCFALLIYAGLLDEIKALPNVFDNFGKINGVHENIAIEPEAVEFI
jgi:hypothetical protein